MIGPPPDPRQVVVDLSPGSWPAGWLACGLLAAAAVALAAGYHRRRPHLAGVCFIAGHVVLLTAPLAAALDRWVLGAWPSVDKTGSYLFYEAGVHRMLLLDPGTALASPAVQLVGLHQGHLWVTELFDLFLGTHGAFDIQGLVYPALAWYCAWRLFTGLGARSAPALILAFPFGMGLHVFRDLHWSTIEKAAVFGIPLYAWFLLRATRKGGGWMAGTAVVFLVAAWLNWYLALVNGALSLLALVAAPRRRTVLAVAGSWLAVLPLVAVQAWLLPRSGALADPERFLWERAVHDVFTLWPPRWYRLEAWRAFNLVGLALGAWGAWRLRRHRGVQVMAVGALGLVLLSTGPLLCGEPPEGLRNPVFMATWHLVPGFWRIAKPEFILELPYLALLAAGALQLSHLRPRAVHLAVLWLAFLGAWWASVRTHPAYPPFTEPVAVELADGWERRLEPARPAAPGADPPPATPSGGPDTGLRTPP